jgi:hypothetical protein
MAKEAFLEAVAKNKDKSPLEIAKAIEASQEIPAGPDDQADNITVAVYKHVEEVTPIGDSSVEKLTEDDFMQFIEGDNLDKARLGFEGLLQLDKYADPARIRKAAGTWNIPKADLEDKARALLAKLPAPAAEPPTQPQPADEQAALKKEAAGGDKTRAYPFDASKAQKFAGELDRVELAADNLKLTEQNEQLRRKIDQLITESALLAAELKKSDLAASGDKLRQQAEEVVGKYGELKKALQAVMMDKSRLNRDVERTKRTIRASSDELAEQKKRFDAALDDEVEVKRHLADEAFQAATGTPFITRLRAEIKLIEQTGSDPDCVQANKEILALHEEEARTVYNNALQAIEAGKQEKLRLRELSDKRKQSQIEQAVQRIAEAEAKLATIARQEAGAAASLQGATVEVSAVLKQLEDRAAELKTRAALHEQQGKYSHELARWVRVETIDKETESKKK